MPFDVLDEPHDWAIPILFGSAGPLHLLLYSTLTTSQKEASRDILVNRDLSRRNPCKRECSIKRNKHYDPTE